MRQKKGGKGRKVEGMDIIHGWVFCVYAGRESTRDNKNKRSSKLDDDKQIDDWPRNRLLMTT